MSKILLPVRGDVKIQVTVGKKLQYYFFNLSHYERSNIGTHCFNTMIYEYLNEYNENWDKRLV